ncbi:uncharacterized protein LOC144148571 [Haemaphysalis longicornis]
MRTYSSTQGGMAFDITYVDANMAQIRASDIDDHARNGNNVANYGVLDIVAKGPDLESLVDKAKRFLADVKALQRQGEDRKLFIGMGLYAFKEGNGLDLFKNIFRKVVNDSSFYTVFAITSTIELPARGYCTVQPTGTRTPLSNLYPAIEDFKELLTNDTQYENALAIVGVSLEMGALVYNLKDNFTEQASMDITDKECDGATLTSPNMVCKSNRTADSAYGLFGFASATDNTRVFAMESAQSVTDKAQIIHEWKNPDIIDRFSWLVFNIQFDNSLNYCPLNNNFSRVRNLKKRFDIT